MVNEPTEIVHIKLMQSGDPSGFDWIFATYHKKVFHYTLRFVQRQEVAEEITSSVLLKIWQIRHSIDTTRSLSGLIFKMTKNLTIGHLRKMARSNALRETFLDLANKDNRNTVEEVILLDEYMELANQAIKQLPPKCRQIYDLHYKDCLDNHSIAERLNISPHTVKSHLLKASNVIKAYLRMHSDIVFLWIIGLLLFWQ
ncbi:MAG: sigma-70 family RNA polymerase sigma factor [Saprospiraceae bacterium]|nr:sigma-70 family RNA polymerase sigma factor [Saprospiraceae bacterium]